MISLKGVLQQLIRSNSQLASGVRDAQILELWPEAVGPHIAKHSKAAFVKQKKLFVEVPQSIWKQECFANKRAILKKLNQTLHRQFQTGTEENPADWIEDIFFI